MRRKTTINEFIEKANIIHTNKYDYSLVNYFGSHTKIKIICYNHGEFEQTPSNHLKGQNCKECFNETRRTPIFDFVEKAKVIHGDKYFYTKVNYISSFRKINIICKIHGEFEQTPHNHLNGNGCGKCNGGVKISIKEFIDKALSIHNNKYDYSKVKYINDKTKIKICCFEHGIFEQLPNSHINGKGCPNCANLIRNINKKFSVDDFINKAKIIHNNKYIYFNDYKNLKTKINILCPIHGIFKQVPRNHIYQKNGCPICKESKGEKEIRQLLDENNIKFTTQHKFSDCKNIKPLPFDFYLPELNICVEYQGEQHHKSFNYFGGEEKLIKIQKNDEIKRNYCLKNNIKMLIINYNDNISSLLNILF